MFKPNGRAIQALLRRLINAKQHQYDLLQKGPISCSVPTTRLITLIPTER
jgi:hypothetical protein